jgi:hypothetical protein
MAVHLAWLVAVIALMTCAAMLGLTAEPSPAAVFEALADGTRACKDLRVVYRDGSDELGWTTVRLSGRYARVLREVPGQEPAEFRGVVPKGTCRSIARAALWGKFWKLRSSRSEPGADETKPSMRLRVPGYKKRVAMPGFAVQNASAFAMMRGTLLVVARHLSKDVVRY